MASRFTDRLLTIVITATVTSAAWIVIGSSYVDPGGRSGSTPWMREERPAGVPIGAQAGSPAYAGVRRAGNDASQPSQPTGSRLIIPVLNVRTTDLTDSYADAREDGERLHEALDITAPAGTGVVAAGPGTIERLFFSEAGGNTIYVRSTDRRTLHYYAHLQDYAPGLEEGQPIRAGQRLGTVGTSGNADPASPHLHFAVLRTSRDAEWWEPGSALNPYPLLGGR